jgi:hypothetical protein
MRLEGAMSKDVMLAVLFQINPQAMFTRRGRPAGRKRVHSCGRAADDRD